MQQDWEAQDERDEEDEQDGGDRPNWSNIEGHHTPRIICPLNHDQNEIMRNFVRRTPITWKNAIDYYLAIRQLVIDNSR